MKALKLIAAIILASGCSKNIGPIPTPKPFSTDTGVFSSEGSHIQGIAVSEEAVFASQDNYLVKLDWTGRKLNARKVINHTGDLCWHGGELYASVANSSYKGSNPEGEGLIQVYDKDLVLVRERKIDRRTDGITILDGVLYLGMGSKTQPSSDAHRINIIGRFDPKTLKEIASRAEFDYGVRTSYGFQDITNDGKYIYATFYSVDGPDTAVFDKDLNIVRTLESDATNGLDHMPERMSGGKNLFIRAKSISTSNPKGISASFDYWTPEE